MAVAAVCADVFPEGWEGGAVCCPVRLKPPSCHNEQDIRNELKYLELVVRRT